MSDDAPLIHVSGSVALVRRPIAIADESGVLICSNPPSCPRLNRYPIAGKRTQLAKDAVDLRACSIGKYEAFFLDRLRHFGFYAMCKLDVSDIDAEMPVRGLLTFPPAWFRAAKGSQNSRVGRLLHNTLKLSVAISVDHTGNKQHDRGRHDRCQNRNVPRLIIEKTFYHASFSEREFMRSRRVRRPC